MIRIKLFNLVGSFAENKDVARKIRIKSILPALHAKEEVTLDFQGVEAATQSFIHALISDVIRKYGGEILDKVYFKNCNGTVQQIISIVAEYLQDA